MSTVGFEMMEPIITIKHSGDLKMGVAGVLLYFDSYRCNILKGQGNAYWIKQDRTATVIPDAFKMLKAGLAVITSVGIGDGKYFVF